MADQPRKARFRLKIFWVLSVFLVILVVAPLVSYSSKTIDTSRNYIEESLRERQLKTAIPAASHIENLMEARQRQIIGLMGTFEIFANDAQYKANFETLLQRGILGRSVSESTLFLSYQDLEGGQFATPFQGVTPAEQSALANLVLPLGREAIERNSQRLSEVLFVKLGYLHGISTPAIALAVPLHSDNRPVAALAGVFLLQDVQESIEEYGREFTMFVTDEFGSLLFASESQRQGKRTNLSDDPIVKRVLSPSAGFPASTVSYTVTRPGDSKSETDLVTCAPIKAYKWLLFSQVDREKYYAPIVELKKSSFKWIASSIIGALLVGLLFARQITRPLSDLTEVSRDLAHGNFHRRAEEKAIMETGELARAFNAMADDIQVYIQKVEAAAEETKQLFMDSIRAIANALDAKDPYTKGHSERVSYYSKIVGEEYGLDERMMRIIEISSLLHDVGKIGIEDRILRKPGALTTEEFDIMKTHPPKGAAILGGIPQMRDIIPGIKHHHEKWQGGGYPDGLKGENIPTIARIIGVADAFDAMTTNRPYQKGMTFERASARLNELCPAVYDPVVMDAFNRAYRRNAFTAHQQKVVEAKLA